MTRHTLTLTATLMLALSACNESAQQTTAGEDAAEDVFIPSPGDPICGVNLYASVATLSLPAELETTLVMPAGYASSEAATQDVPAAVFSNGDAVFGYIVRREIGEGEPFVATNGEVLADISRCSDCATQFSLGFTRSLSAWSSEPLVQNALTFEYGAGSPNAALAERDPAELRDTLVGALIDDPAYQGGESGEPCASITSYMFTLQREDHAITAGLLTCSDNLSATESLTAQFEDFYSATTVAPRRFGPVDFNCLITRDTCGEPDFLDVLWVVDNSASMVDELPRVEEAARHFFDTLTQQSHHTQWRLGVTTTEAWMLDDTSGVMGNGSDGTGSHRNFFTETNPDWPGGPDERMNVDRGLRGTGFVSWNAPVEEARAEFLSNVLEDEGCVRDGAPEGANVCGWHEQRGLLSALDVLARLEASDDPRYQLRPGSRRMVVFVSGDEDWDFRTPAGVLPDGDERSALTATFSRLIEEYGASAHAIAGDEGTDAGGLCDPSTTPYGQAYRDVAITTGGLSASICDGGLRSMIDVAIPLKAKRCEQLTLPDDPIPHSIHATTADGEELPRSFVRGWSYDVSRKALTYHNLGVAADTDIFVGYLHWRVWP